MSPTEFLSIVTSDSASMRQRRTLPGTGGRALVTIPLLRVQPTDTVVASGHGVALVMRCNTVFA
ncbi:MAG: hypothetical protein ABI083_00660 [Lapillicoccus sp.]